MGIKKAHRDVICEQYPMPNGKINIFIEFDNGEITSKFPHHQKKSAFFSKKCFITQKYTKKAGIVQTPALSIRLECHCFGKSITISSLNIPVTFIGGMIMPLKGVPSVLQ